MDVVLLQQKAAHSHLRCLVTDVGIDAEQSVTEGWIISLARAVGSMKRPRRWNSGLSREERSRLRD